MKSESLRRLIERVVDEVLTEHVSAGGAPPTPKPTVLMTGTSDGLEVILHQMKRLREELGPMRAVLSETFREIVAPSSFTADTGIDDLITSLTLPEAEALASATSMLIVGTLSFNSLAKMAAGITDSVPSRLWEAARDAEIPITIANPPKPLVPGQRPDLNAARQQQRQERLSVLREDGAEIIPAGDLLTHVQRRLAESGDPVAAKRLRLKGPRAIITVEDVDRAHRRGVKTWEVERDAIVTAAAYDRARDLGITMTGGNIP